MIRQKSPSQILRQELHTLTFSDKIKRDVKVVQDKEFKKAAEEVRKTFKDEDFIQFGLSC